MARRQRRHKRLLIGLLLLLPLTFLGWNQATFNFDVLLPRRVYRSGQMPAWALASTLRNRQIKTVVNLRGPNPGEHWYQSEVAATLAAGASHVDLSLSSCVWMSRIQFRTLVRIRAENTP